MINNKFMKYSIQKYAKEKKFLLRINNNVIFTRKIEEITVDIKKNMIIIIAASVLTIILFLIILIFIDSRFNSYKKTKNNELIYVNNRITNIEQSEDLKIYFNENEYYVIPSFLDLDKAIHIDDELEIHYKKVNNENVIYVLYDNDFVVIPSKEIDI